MATAEPPTIRPATPRDRAAVLALVPRLRHFGPAGRHTAAELDRGEQRTLDRFFETPPEGVRLWVAEAAGGEVIGMAYAEPAVDYFTEEPHAHLGILAVAAAAEGRGVGRALLARVEQWAEEQGYRFLTLNVFVDNTRARAVYERAGYHAEALRYVKAL